MQPLYSVTEIRAIETAAAGALPPGALMARAGMAAADAALALLLPCVHNASVLVLAGPGNNGGDALEAANHLSQAGARVTVLHCPPDGAPSPERAAAWQRAAAGSSTIIDVGAHAVTVITGTRWRLVVDGLFGIGLARPVAGAMRALVQAVNELGEMRHGSGAGRSSLACAPLAGAAGKPGSAADQSGCPVLALDVPSGLDADTGAVVGADGIAIRATRTITFIGDKPGLHTNAGRDHAGAVAVAALAIDAALFPPTGVQLNDTGLFVTHLRARRHDSNKGSYGNVAVIGGARGMAGAPILAARTALNSGAGRVYVLYPEEALAADSGQPELMCRLAEGYDLENATLVIGPGLGSSDRARELLARAIASGSALLADADALNLIAADPALQQALARRAVPAVLTPHPLEATRLLGPDTTVAQVQADRIATARTLAARLNAIVVLKGSGTVIAMPDGDCAVNPTGNPALATAGTGDVLSGLCGSLLAQGWPQWEAALAAVWLHGTAADDLVAAGIGPIGLTAGELIPAIRAALNRAVRHIASAGA
ncbi:MAG: NAD(P)H-hydrate dehydratase [Duganella sp.]